MPLHDEIDTRWNWIHHCIKRVHRWLSPWLTYSSRLSLYWSQLPSLHFAIPIGQIHEQLTQTDHLSSCLLHWKVPRDVIHRCRCFHELWWMISDESTTLMEGESWTCPISPLHCRLVPTIWKWRVYVCGYVWSTVLTFCWYQEGWYSSVRSVQSNESTATKSTRAAVIIEITEL
jgi:hypothetical protein